MLTVHANRGAKRYRYYLSRAAASGEGTPGSLKRVSVGMLETFILEHFGSSLSQSWRPDLDGIERLAEGLSRMTVGEDRIEARFLKEALHPRALASAEAGDDPATPILRVAFEMRRRQGAVVLRPAGAKLEAGKPDRTLVRALVLARQWAGELERGEAESIKGLAQREALCSHYTTRLLRLAYLAPDIASDILAGRQPALLTLGALTKQPLPLAWDRQRALVNSLG